MILFDWNGTVVLDTERARESLNAVLLARSGRPLDEASFQREFHLPMDRMFRRLGISDVRAAEREWNDGMTRRGTRAREGADSLRELARLGVRLGVVSAADSASVLADMEGLGLAGIWDTVDAPTADKLATLTARRGSETRAYYVGDTVYDMRCAQAAGYVPLAVDRGYTRVSALVGAGATAVLDTFDDLRALLDR